MSPPVEFISFAKKISANFFLVIEDTVLTEIIK